MKVSAMKNLLIITMAAIAPFLILYAFGAFISFEPNPENWSENGRFLLVFLGLIATPLSVGLLGLR